MQLLDPVHLQPSFRQQIVNYQSNGVVAKVNLCRRLAATAPRARVGRCATGRGVAGRILVGDDPTTSNGRSMRRVRSHVGAAVVEVQVPTLTDRTLAPDGRHVLSIYAQYFPYRLRESDWDARRDAVGKLVIDRLSEVMPGSNR